ncbi:MAG: glutamine-hydrolyzing carbamoyl-phosphate synthase small subunit [Chloroflexi bacterium]|nr:glutamine-hydrolyzing carbamoyl-phosphate synthase small subunit [Chloroflexota bacterium]
MSKRAFLALEDGSVYEGYSFGAEETTYGEVVFNTSMTGYQEMLTDPSYAGQILTLTYPLIGNYGISEADFESKHVQARGLIVREYCPAPSHWQSTTTLDEFLKLNGIPALAGADTRSLTRRLRFAGVMMGILSSKMKPQDALDELKQFPRYESTDFVHGVSTEEAYFWPRSESDRSYHVVVIDCGLKYNILRLLSLSGCLTRVVPDTTEAEQIIALEPDGVLLSPGPGDPARLMRLEETARKLLGKKPIMGICLGHQILARALGARTFKLKFGHRGGNHPVRELSTGKVKITAQNHGYAVDADSLKHGLEVSHINLNDGTVEGLIHRGLPIVSTQYHAEASPGPQDNVYLFDRFLEMMREEK